MRFSSKFTQVHFACHQNLPSIVPIAPIVHPMSSPPPNPAVQNNKTIAIIGASNDPAKFGNKAVRAYLQKGYTVFPVHHKDPLIEGLKSYPSIADVPRRPHRVSVYVSPTILLTILPAIAARGCDELWLNPGTVNDEVLTAASQLNLRVIHACSLIDIQSSPEF